MKVVIDSSGEYTPIYCSVCSKESRITIYFTNHVWLCLECIRKAGSLLENATNLANRIVFHSLGISKKEAA